jgi:hypothetical protein
MTAPVDNRVMRAPSHQRQRASRALVLRTALGAVLAALALVPAATAAPGDRGVFVSKGAGRQIFAGGGGVAYGVVFSGASLVVVDYSAARDMKVDTPVLPTTNADGSRTYVPAGGQARTAFRISGTLYRVTVTGSSTFNAAAVYGRLQLRGKGTLVVNGRKDRWNGPAVKLGKVPKAVKPLFEAAILGTPLPAPPPPVVPPVPPPVTTTTEAARTSTG